MVNAHLLVKDRPGISKSKDKAIDILSFSFGATNTAYGSGASGRDSRAGRADVSGVTVMKKVDKVSPLLFDDCVTGNVLPEVVLSYDKSLGDQQEEYFKLTLENAIITSIQLSGSNEDPFESLSFAAEKIKVSYNSEGDDHKLQGWVEKGFDLATLKPY